MAAPRVGLVLGAGGLAGTAFHAGVVAALEAETGFDARRSDIIVGTSAGATTAALLRAGLSPRDLLARMTGETMSDDGERLMARVPRPPGARDDRGRGRHTPSRRFSPLSPGALAQHARRPWRARPGQVAAALAPAGQVPTAEMVEVFGSLHPTWPHEPLWLCAVDVDSGRRHVIGAPDSRGLPGVDVGQAVAASCAIPGYFEPVKVEHLRLVDGAVHSFCNADVLLGADVDVVVVSAPMSGRDVRWSDGWRHAVRRQLRSEVRRLRAEGKSALVLHPLTGQQEAMSGGMLDPGTRAPTARSTFASVRAWLRWTTHPVPWSLRSTGR